MGDAQQIYDYQPHNHQPYDSFKKYHPTTVFGKMHYRWSEKHPKTASVSAMVVIMGGIVGFIKGMMWADAIYEVMLVSLMTGFVLRLIELMIRPLADVSEAKIIYKKEKIKKYIIKDED